MERGHRADAHDAGPFGANWRPVWGQVERGHRADAHDAGPFGANWKGDIEKGNIESMLMMLARLGPTGKGTSS